MGNLRPYIDTIQKVSSKQNDEHLRRSIRASASVDTDVCAGRCGRLRRSIRTSASVDADICVGRRGCSTTNINIRNETSFYHTKLSPAQPLLSANLQRRIHRRVAVGHEAQHQLAEPAALEPPDFVIVSPKNLRQRVLLFSDALPSALFGCKPPCSEVA